ncbi:hypothetical protein KC8_11150 [Sphingomonas sp. KC8]|nr:hypothetical protein KC8_11150 [Sphingomonas sp. KC8]
MAGGMTTPHFITSLAGAAALVVGLSGLSATPASTAPAVGEEASIPFVSAGSIRDFRVVDRDTLYVQDIQRNWYRAELMAPCTDLPFAETIGFDVRGTNRFDRFSSVLVRGQHCPLKSLVVSAPPPKKAKKKG